LLAQQDDRSGFREQALMRERFFQSEALKKIVQELYATVKLKAGDTAYPVHASGYAKYGASIVIGVCKTYKDFGTDGVWNDDNPMIITFSPLKKREEHIFCTADYLVHRNPHIITC
jgi:hypothetical protein